MSKSELFLFDKILYIKTVKGTTEKKIYLMKTCPKVLYDETVKQFGGYEKLEEKIEHLISLHNITQNVVDSIGKDGRKWLKDNVKQNAEDYRLEKKKGLSDEEVRKMAMGFMSYFKKDVNKNKDFKYRADGYPVIFEKIIFDISKNTFHFYYLDFVRELGGMKTKTSIELFSYNIEKDYIPVRTFLKKLYLYLGGWKVKEDDKKYKEFKQMQKLFSQKADKKMITPNSCRVFPANEYSLSSLYKILGQRLEDILLIDTKAWKPGI